MQEIEFKAPNFPRFVVCCPLLASTHAQRVSVPFTEQKAEQWLVVSLIILSCFRPLIGDFNTKQGKYGTF